MHGSGRGPRYRFGLYWEAGADGHWLWTGDRYSTGYGRFDLYGRQIPAHRAAYILFVGPIPPGYDIDHLCRNILCVNPAHLEPVTPAENRRRAGPYHRLMVCQRGHEMSGDNLGYRQRASRDYPERYCKTCNRSNTRRLKEAS